MKFDKLNADSRSVIDRIYASSDYLGCEYLHCYQRAWLSRDEDLCCAIDDGVVYLAFCASHLAEFCEKDLFLPPLTSSDKIIDAYANLAQYCVEKGQSFCVARAPDEHVELLGNRYNYMRYTNESEYIYASDDLINLSGKKYHAKRNHIARFIKEYRNYTCNDYQSGDYDRIMALYTSWSNQKDVNEEDCEMHALSTILNHNNNFGLKILLLNVDAELVAFAIGEVSVNNVGIVHFEKANTEYIGAYAMINHLFSSKYFNHVKWVNRQEDMGIDGLRKAKLSYYPSRMVNKWFVTFK